MEAKKDTNSLADLEASQGKCNDFGTFEVKKLATGELANPKKARFDRMTDLAVNLATFAYLPLQVPQIIKNFGASDAELGKLEWQGIAAGALGNLLLCTFFAGLGEWSAVRVQAIGAITNFIVVTQIYSPGFVPPVAFFVLTGVIVVGLTLPLLLALKVLPGKVWTTWQEGTTAIGLSALLFSLSATATHNNVVIMVVSVVGFAVAAVPLVLRPPALMPLMSQLSGWLATLLFMFMPLPQIFAHFRDYDSAKSFSMGFVILGTIGNGLCISRALFTKNAIWFTGAVWGTIVGAWAMALSVSVAGHLHVVPLIAYTIGLSLYFAVLLKLNGDAQGESLLGQLQFVVKGE